jgi:hypothetical protein
MVIDDFDIFRARIRPTKANSPLIVDPNAVLADSITRECFKVITGRHP